MAITKKKLPVTKSISYSWEAIDRNNKATKGEMSAAGEAVVQSALRKQGFTKIKVKKTKIKRGRTITQKDMTIFTRQLATMLKSGVPLLQGLELVGSGHQNPSMQSLVHAIKTDIESGNTLTEAISKHPNQFDKLYCNLIEAGEQAGILEGILERIAVYQEKTMALKSKIKGALFYPTSIVVVAFIIVAVIMIWVIPAFKEMFASFGGDLPLPTKIVMIMSDWFVAYWWALFSAIGGIVYTVKSMFKKSVALQNRFDAVLLKVPVFGDLVEKGALARWSRTLATMFAAGVPLVEALESVAGASGNYVYESCTQVIKTKVSTGNTLTQSMNEAAIFPNMMIQMTSIGEEAGALDDMLNKVADFYESEVDDAVSALTSLMEPMIMVFLGVIIGGLVVALYLPIFKMGSIAK